MSCACPVDPLQVTTLQQRVVALQQSHEVQDKELARLRAETLALAARTAAASTGSPGVGSAQRSGSSSGSRGGTGDQQAHQLQQQVAQLQEANTWLQQQLGGWGAGKRAAGPRAAVLLIWL
jgi:hypothetical protein